MSRQQFRTNTNRSISKVPREVNGPASIIGSISYDSGVSHVSRKTLPIPQTIHKTDTKNVGREEHIQNVKVILAGELHFMYFYPFHLFLSRFIYPFLNRP